jgi:hypothetical protein
MNAPPCLAGDSMFHGRGNHVTLQRDVDARRHNSLGAVIITMYTDTQIRLPKPQFICNTSFGYTVIISSHCKCFFYNCLQTIHFINFIETYSKFYWGKTQSWGDSKMAARGRKQKACFLQWNLGEMLETHLTGKATQKRQNFDPSTPPACAENLHFTLKGETRRAPQATSRLHPDGLGRHRQGELSGMRYSHRQPWARSA